MVDELDVLICSNKHTKKNGKFVNQATEDAYVINFFVSCYVFFFFAWSLVICIYSSTLRAKSNVRITSELYFRRVPTNIRR